MTEQLHGPAEGWQYFRWQSPQLPELLRILGVDLAQRRQPYEIEQADIENDADELSIAREWCRALASMVERWCVMLEVDPTPIPEFRRAKRAGEKFGLINPEPLVVAILELCLRHPGLSQKGFRPKILERANNEILRWLAAHPSDVDRIHHRTFEAVLKEVIAGSGWDVELTKRTRDGGYDLVCLANSSVGMPIKMVVELKLLTSHEGLESAPSIESSGLPPERQRTGLW